MRRLFTLQLLQQFVGEGEGGSGTLGGGDVAVDGHQVGGVGGTLQQLFEARVARRPTTVEHSQLGEHHGRRGTDGSHQLAGFVLGGDSLTDALVFIEVAGAGHTTGQQQQVGIAEAAVGKHGVGNNLHAVCRFHHL